MKWPQPIDLVDVLAYLVVLGLFVQFFPAVISESFVLSLLTAVLLKLVVEVVVVLKGRIVTRLKGATSTRVRITSLAMLFAVMAGSKFLVIELTALVFGDAVYLGGFFLVTALIVTLVLARQGLRLLLRQPQGV